MEEFAVAESTRHGFRCAVIFDQDPRNPLEDWDTVGTFYVPRRGYGFGGGFPQFGTDDRRMPEDMTAAETAAELRAEYPGDLVTGCRFEDYGSNGGRVYVVDDVTDANVLHVIDAADIGKEWQDTVVNGRTVTARHHARRYVRGIVETVDAYFRGDVYGYVVRDPYGTTLESVWGYYGETEYPLTEAEAAADWHAVAAVRRYLAAYRDVENVRDVAAGVTAARELAAAYRYLHALRYGADVDADAVAA